MIFRHRVKINGVHYAAGVDVPIEEEGVVANVTAPLISAEAPEPEETVIENIEKPVSKKRGRKPKN